MQRSYAWVCFVVAGLVFVPLDGQSQAAQRTNTSFEETQSLSPSVSWRRCVAGTGTRWNADTLSFAAAAPDAPTRAQRLLCLRAYLQATSTTLPIEQQLSTSVEQGVEWLRLGNNTEGRALLRSVITRSHALRSTTPMQEIGIDDTDPYPAFLRARRREEQRERRLSRNQLGAAATGVVSPFHETVFGTASVPNDRLALQQRLGNDASERVLDAVAQARFELALTHTHYIDHPFPRFTGSTSVEFQRWSERTLEPFLRARLFYVTEFLSPQLQRTIELGRAPFHIAATAQLAELFFDFARSLRNLEVPPVSTDPSIVHAYPEPCDPPHAQFEALATQGFESCVRLASATHSAPSTLAFCERRLSELHPQRYPHTSELTPSLRDHSHEVTGLP